MSSRRSATAGLISEMARQHQVQYVGTASDDLADHITRLAGDSVVFDEVEQTLLALQRAGHLSRRDLVHLQARYLREAKP
ncbi:conserved hypothetical protein [Rhodopseudomonas palustris TIE-1]|uniref:hypothetical protein n=1 Tax=Rhodopseudomonas palustris TaxID=1076 RepID=UPI00016494E8|nr:hypothetical protein [Rhodopseudomonas palustris]ACF02850.1 conserved hypothetical protein [Rhodopseudomonas palustris TIE-1]